MLLTNDKPASYHAEPADKVLSEISKTEFSPATKSVSQVLSMAQSIRQNEGNAAADVYYYSDFQQSAFSVLPDKELMQQITFYGLPVQNESAADIYIDTAYLTTPVLQAGKSNYLIVHTRSQGKQPEEKPVLKLAINGQVKSAASLDFSGSAERTDTLSFQVNGAEWQKMELTVNDASVRFDDTFRITARSSPNLSVMVLNEGQSNPYIQAAFRAYNGFRLNQAVLSGALPNLKQYNLVILNGITRMDEAAGKAINGALQQGQSICIFPGRTNNFQSLNAGLKQVGELTITGIDTAVQTAGSLQQGSTLIRDLFDKIPDNVQLPVANWHYVLSAGLSANQQSILSFRNGDPFLARYTPARGQLYICAVSADLQSGNFPGSYFFTPFLYQMAAQSTGSSIYAITLGKQQPVTLPMLQAQERNTMHLYGAGLDVIPAQRPNGSGIDVFVDQTVQQPGFYALYAAGSDTAQIALNQDKEESKLEFRDIAALKTEWKSEQVKWIDITESGSAGANNSNDFPLWKVCVLLAIVMLCLETFLLAKKPVVVTA